MDELRARRVYCDSTLTIATVESTEIDRVRTGNCCLIVGKSAPIAVVVSSPDTQYALTMDAKRADLDRLKQEVAGLDAILLR